MSESNNNTPMRITQLEEATSYPEGAYLPIAKAGYGTKKIDANRTTSGMLDLLNNGFYINNYKWQRGGLDGTTITTQLYRLVTTDLQIANGDVVVKNSNSTYKFLIVWTKDGTDYSSDWIQTNDNNIYKVPDGSTFRIVIAKVSENYQALTPTEVSEMSKILYVASGLYNKYNDILFNKNASMYGKGVFDHTDFRIGVHYTNGSYYKETERVTTKDKMSFPFDTKISVNQGYRYGLVILDSQGTPILNTGFITDDYFISANTYFYLNIDNGSSSATAVIDTYVKQISFKTPIGIEIDNLKEEGAYYYTGVDIKPQQHGFNTSQLSWSYSAPTTQGEFTPQGMSYSNGVVFKCWKNDLIQLYNFSDGTKIAEYSITSEHGDCMDFSNEYYESGDEFPLAYFTSDTSPLKVYVNRLTRSSGTLIRTLLFPIENAGYYAGHAIDAENNRIVTLGYSENDFETDADGANVMICSVWDLNELTQNEDTTYTPKLLKTFNLPFIICTQDQCYYNNKFFVISSNWRNTNTIIYVIDIGEESVVSKFDNVPYQTWETEGIFWVDDNMFVNANGITKYEFV